MSLVTTVILSIPNTDENNIREINGWLECKGLGKFGKSAEEINCGLKQIEGVGVYVSAFNYIDIDGFIEFMKILEWILPDDVQVFVLGSEDMKFSERTLT